MDESARLKKMTFALPVPLLAKLRSLADRKRISSANAAVREALEEYVVKLEREDFQEAMKAAASDPEFLRDIEATETAFRHADAETARMMTEW
ncbi:MAG: ribbon-helix-helix domain-containing protein [Bacillota bacterium]